MGEHPASPIPTFEWPSMVAWDELDMMGLLHHSRFAVHVERAFSALLEHLGHGYDPDPSVNPDRRHAVVSLTACFESPVSRPGPVIVRLSVVRLGTSSLTMAWSLHSADGMTRHAQGERVIVHVDEANKPAAWSRGFRATLSSASARSEGTCAH